MALNADVNYLMAQSIREPVQLVSREVVAVSLCSASLCNRLVPAVDEVLAVTELWVPGVSHVGPDPSVFAIRSAVHTVINPHTGQVINTASALEESTVWVLDEAAPGLQILDDLDAGPHERICPLEVPMGSWRSFWQCCTACSPARPKLRQSGQVHRGSCNPTW